MPQRRPLVGPVAAVLLLAALLGGCSRGEDAAKEAITESILANPEAFGMDRQQAECVADGLVEELGTDALRASGILAGDGESRPGPIDMDPAQADRAAGVVVGCGGIKEQVLGELPEVAPEVRECVDAALTEDVLSDYVASVLTRERAQGERELRQVVQGCLTEERR